MFKRVVIKLSGEALAGMEQTKEYVKMFIEDTRDILESDGEIDDKFIYDETKKLDKAKLRLRFDDDVIGDIISQIKDIMDAGCEVALVVGGGNFWRGRDSKEDIDKVRSDQIGMMATVMNAVYLTDMLEKAGIDSVVLTPVIIGTVTQQFSKKAALKYMAEKNVVIFAAGTGHPFFSTDTIAAIRTAELEADALLFAKNVDGVYDSDPNQNHRAIKLKNITYRSVIENNLTVIDTAASAICEEQKILSIIFKLDEPDAIVKCVSGDEDEILKIGTTVTV
ncbi:MAG: uridine monophosphate kinase [Defluviitaleaceae bacterium]|nr:uridine monophosphate kinase [Defluviitaleaceae bacterium]